MSVIFIVFRSFLQQNGAYESRFQPGVHRRSAEIIQRIFDYYYI